MDVGDVYLPIEIIRHILSYIPIPTHVHLVCHLFLEIRESIYREYVEMVRLYHPDLSDEMVHKVVISLMREKVEYRETLIDIVSDPHVFSLPLGMIVVVVGVMMIYIHDMYMRLTSVYM